MNTTELGRYGEELAVKFLKKKKYKILAKNYRVGKNEIDIVAEDKDCIVFVEVKTRSENAAGGFDFALPSDAVDSAKQRRTIAASDAYLYKNEELGEQSEYRKMIRFDIIEVYLKRSRLTRSPALLKIEHMEDAFRP